MNPLRLACLAAALLLLPVAAEAAVGFTITGPPGGIVTGITTTFAFTVTNTADEPLREFDFRVRNNFFTITAATGPTPDFTCTITSSGARVTCTAPCTAPGLVQNAQGPLALTMAVKVSASVDTVETITFTGGGTTGCTTSADASVNFSLPIRVLELTASASPASLLGPPNTSNITWTVTNHAGAAVNNIGLTVSASPGTTGASGTCSGTLTTLGPGQTGTITCTYSFTGSGTCALTGTAKNFGSTSTSPPQSITIDVGKAAAAWTRAAIAYGRPDRVLRLTVNNASLATVSQVDVLNPTSTGWALSAGTPPTATNGLAFAAGGSSAADVVFTGALAPGGSSDLVIPFDAVPTVTTTTPYTFTVRLTPAEGPSFDVEATQQVNVVVPISDVAAFTVRNDLDGKLLTWSNTSIPGSAHAGVVVFASTTVTDPGLPDDFQTYTAGSNGVVYADATGSSVTDATPGSVRYRVCNHDAFHVYSSCRTGLENDGGWLSSEVFPDGGWVHALGGDALVRAGLLPGSRIGQANNSPAVAVLDVATGARSFAPVAIPGLPSVNSPAAILRDNSRVLFAADQNGNVTAIDLDTGALKWTTPFVRPGEKFMAGVSGIILSGASTQFQTDYATDVLLVGSGKPGSTGNVYAIDAVTGEELWNLAVGTPIHGLITYDPGSNFMYVPTSGAGVKAYDLSGTGRGVRPSGTPITWAPDDPELSSGDYRFCIRTASSLGIACLDAGGMLRVVNKSTGKLLAPAFPTGISSPTGLARISGTAGQGFVVSNASTAQVISAAGTPYTIQFVGPAWTPDTGGATISTPLVLANDGYYVVAASDGTLYRISLTDGTKLSRSPPITSQNTSVLLAQPFHDAGTNRFLFGTNDGHLWAIPYF